MQNLCGLSFLQGCGTGAGLIIAIGAQNAFVLKQGISHNHIFVTALICAVIDACLIAVGVGGVGKILTSNQYLLETAKWGGAAFLFYYGFRSFRSAFGTSTLALDGFETPPLKATVMTLLALSLLNPHVYLDTVVLLGSIGAQFPPLERTFFALGAMLASFIWFFALSYGASYLTPLFENPKAWKILDTLIGCIMWAIAISLLLWHPDASCEV